MHPNVTNLIRECGLPPLEARLLMTAASGMDRVSITTHPTTLLDQPAVHRFTALVARRLSGEPIAYLIGHREFYGREFFVDAAVLIPRPETELLIDEALAQPVPGRQRILDLGTGSGVIAITLALECPQAEVTGTDLSAASLAVAKRNALKLGASVRWVHSNWFKNLDEERFDLILSNPPYIAQDDPHLEQGDLRFEPALALSSGPGGLAALTEIVQGAALALNAGGYLLVEHGYDQAPVVRELFRSAGFENAESVVDLQGIERVTRGRRPVRT